MSAALMNLRFSTDRNGSRTRISIVTLEPLRQLLSPCKDPDTERFGDFVPTVADRRVHCVGALIRCHTVHVRRTDELALFHKAEHIARRARKNLHLQSNDGDGPEVRQAEFVSIDSSENLRDLIAEGLESGEGREATDIVLADLREAALGHET